MKRNDNPFWIGWMLFVFGLFALDHLKDSRCMQYAETPEARAECLEGGCR